ncbi:hypothetical protein O6H91_15G037300 [Diphasiastrum complanatum]|uniref:Uncharacterized protein n=3 Tax=Diphasiastrum complanatum TaxID=34168 RepID=A0ACC2BHE4_DIPCM|nr:hypothetical protein O6H91_15G037300 [Diphasiastrum complanatum]KAJ7529197.1 hypothetical protein O6H91_15G037300 [Diphasiastrum complanatum]KAJ7529200.1 hypothetical protein O6H91_15G037300 [Diphasiastrum complanatum]
MPPRRWGAPGSQLRGRSGRRSFSTLALLAISVILSLVFLAGRISNFSSSLARVEFWNDPSNAHRGETSRRLSALKRIETYFPREVLDVIIANSEGYQPLNRNIRGGNDQSSSLIKEKMLNMARKDEIALKGKEVLENLKETEAEDQLVIASDAEHVGELVISRSYAEDNSSSKGPDPAQGKKTKMWLQKQNQRLKELMQQSEEEKRKLEDEAIEQPKMVNRATIGKYSVWRSDENENSDSLVRLMKDQLIMARVYASIAQARHNTHLFQSLKLRITESQRSLGEASIDADLAHSALERIREMGKLLTQARKEHPDCYLMVKKLRAMLQSAEVYARTLKKQSTFLSQLAAKTIPKGLNCLALRLNVEYYATPLEQRDFPHQENLEDPSLYHYALFSDNILAASVVVNSTVLHAKESEKHVFHLVTDKLNFGAMKMWFLANPPGKATIHVQNVDEFKWLNASYSPVLRQLEHKAMRDYYFKQDQATSLASMSSNLKYRNPKYLSMLNHLRFYLPQVYPKVDKILFLDDDIVVQKDLTPLWDVDLHGKVNGAVETCGASFHRFDKYLNFSNPHIARNFDPNACGWAYGMNIFDLKEWKRRDITGIYHRWQNMNEDRVLWKLGTLPPGLITFYNMTYALDKSWHVLGLGYNPSIERTEIDAAAVVHYNGNLKPWLDIGFAKYKPHWTKYVKFDHSYLKQCNINE